MIPKPEYCVYCGGYTGKNVMVDSMKDPPLGSHRHLEDCIAELRRLILDLQSQRKRA